MVLLDLEDGKGDAVELSGGDEEWDFAGQDVGEEL